MEELSDRRARKKALTREHIRRTAQEMFAERGFDPVTIADVARAADVAVQTVFNHFPTKEELFFAERIPWVTEPADAVRSRPPGVSALDALRAQLVTAVSEIAAWQLTPEGRSCLAAIEASPALAIHERELVHAAECKLSAALREAWADEPEPATTGTVLLGDPVTAAPLTAAIWMAAVRVLVLDQRGARARSDDPAVASAQVAALAGTLLGGIQAQLAAKPQDADRPSMALRAG